MAYAEGTDVPISRSKAEIEALLTKAGASRYATDTDNTKGTAHVLFRIGERDVRLAIRLPKLADFAKIERDVVVTRRPLLMEKKSFDRSPTDQARVFEQVCRQRWRQTLLLVKAKLTAVEIGASTIEREFLADIYLANGQTVHEALVTKLKASSGGPFLLGAGGDR